VTAGRAVNHAPAIIIANVAAARGQVLPLSNLFWASDADGDALQVTLFDGTADPASGHFVVNGVAQPANQFLTLTAAQLAQTTFQAGSVGDSLWGTAFDGTEWGPGQSFQVNVPNHAPAIIVANVNAARGQVLPLSNLFWASDADD
jgi:hypothetical protein